MPGIPRHRIRAREASPAPDLLVWPGRPRTRAVALLLPGGASDSTEPASRLRPSGLRVLVLGADLARVGHRRGLAVAVLRYRLAGWNGDVADPVRDARWALGELTRRFGPVPVALVGHSMGGRTALRVAGGEHVAGVVALAPWLPPGEPVAEFVGRTVVVAHGDADTVTDERASRAWTGAASARGIRARYITVRGGNHSLLKPFVTWQRIARQGVGEIVGSILRPATPD